MFNILALLHPNTPQPVTLQQSTQLLLFLGLLTMSTCHFSHFNQLLMSSCAIKCPFCDRRHSWKYCEMDSFQFSSLSCRIRDMTLLSTKDKATPQKFLPSDGASESPAELLRSWCYTSPLSKVTDTTATSHKWYYCSGRRTVCSPSQRESALSKQSCYPSSRARVEASLGAAPGHVLCSFEKMNIHSSRADLFFHHCALLLHHFYFPISAVKFLTLCEHKRWPFWEFPFPSSFFALW